MEKIPYADFARLEMRVAKIVSADVIPGKSRIVRGRIDIGDELRDVIIGGAQYYTCEEMVGRTVIAIINLEPKEMAGVVSNAMLLAADIDGRPYWLTTDGDVPPGSPIR